MADETHRLESLKKAATSSASKLGAGLSGALNTFSGKSLEQKIDEYSEVYSQVLIGLYQEVSALQKEHARSQQALKTARWFLIASGLLNLCVLLWILVSSK